MVHLHTGVDMFIGFATVTQDMLENTWGEIYYRLDVLLATKGAQIEVY
jgi:hypothetical protein